ARYAVDKQGQPIKNIPYRIIKEIGSRAYYGDLPIIDVKLSPAAAAGVTGAAAGVALFAPAVKAVSVRGALYRSGTGGAQFLGFSGVSQKTTEITGSPTAGFIFGLGAAKGIGSLSKAVRPYVAPAKQVSLQADLLKRTGDFKVGHKGVATTRIREVAATRGGSIVGRGPKTPILRKTIPKTGLTDPKPLGQTTIGYGKKIGSEIPIQVKVTDAFGESITVPTTRGITTLKTTDVGIGRGFKPRGQPTGVVHMGRARAGLLIDPLRRGIGGRQPIAQQDFISTAYAGVGKKQVGV
ncbi:unnamed protein product, partial [marine sediment metagenome]